MIQMTALQRSALGIIKDILHNHGAFQGGWLKPSYVMAHIEIESSWHPVVHSADGLGSVGLMQVLPSTASGVGMAGKDQSDPATSILTGMLYIAECHRLLAPRPYDPFIVIAYNAGPMRAMRGFSDPLYLTAWRGAQHKWSFVDDLDALHASGSTSNQPTNQTTVTTKADKEPSGPTTIEEADDAEAERLNREELDNLIER